MAPARIGCVVQHLERVGGAVLRIVELVAERRKPGHPNEAEAEIARVAGQLRQTDGGVDAGSCVFVKGAGSHSVEPHPYLIEEDWGE